MDLIGKIAGVKVGKILQVVVKGLLILIKSPGFR